MQPYNVLDLPADDGVRDPFRWSRLATPSMLAFGTLLVVAVLVVLGTGRDGDARRSAHAAGMHVVESAHRLTASANVQ